MPLTVRTVTGHYTLADNVTPAAGTVTFTPSTTLAATTSDVIVPAEPVVAKLDNTGAFSVGLVPTDVAEISPTGWTYTVVERINGAPARAYNVLIASGMSALDLATVSPAVPQPAVQQYVLLAGGTMTGPLVLDGNPPLEIPAGAGANKVLTSDASGNASWAASSGGPPNGNAGGDLGSTYPNPTVVATHLASPLPVAQGGTAAASAAAALTSLGAAASSRQIAAGAGLTGGGDLSADRTLAVSYGSASGTACQGNDSRLTDLGMYPARGYGMGALSIDPMTVQASSGLGSQIWVTRLWIPAGVSITNLWAAVRTGGTWDGLTTPNQLGLYDDTGTKVAATADDGTLWTAAGWRGGALVGGSVAAQSNGRFVYILISIRGMSGLVVPFPASASDSNAPYAAVGVGGATNRRTMYAAGASSIPASFTPSSYGTASGFIPVVGVS